MTGELPTFLERADPRQRHFPPSWRDAAIRVSRDASLGGVRCPGCDRLFCRPSELRRLHGDHIIPYSRGGLTVWSNLQLLCATCNLKKNAKM